MRKLENLQPQAVFKYFDDICSIPHGSGNTKAISDYCVNFAKEHNLSFEQDGWNNIIIRKPAAKGYETHPTVILQGHLDMVCQKTADSDFDFENDPLKLYTDGDFISAENTTLGADNGIAVALVLSILADNALKHPAIEAVFTSDEETGMYGAQGLNTESLKGTYFINLDSEEDDTVTVSCAGGSEFSITLNKETKDYSGTPIKITLDGLKGGHSGVEIDKGRVNANILAGRLLNHLKNKTDFRVISINGGEKTNAITLRNDIELSVKDKDLFITECEQYLSVIKDEISAREPNFKYDIKICENTDTPLSKELTEKIIFLLATAPNGIIEMSAEIDGLVETSLNLGILQTGIKEIKLSFALRSNKSSALAALEEKLIALASVVDCKYETAGHYPPWEYIANNPLLDIYVERFEEFYGTKPKIEAIHAGLECGVFTSKIPNLCCIAVGPQMYDVHTVNERLSISSTEKFTKLILSVLEQL